MTKIANVSNEEILEELRGLVGEELKDRILGLKTTYTQCISYKWLARRYTIGANRAKQILFHFADLHREKVFTTYLLAGWTNEGTEHVFQLVDGKDVQEAKKKLKTVTSMHVYSVQPSQPKDATDVWNTDSEQTSALFDSMVKKMETNCLCENRLSAIQCPEAKRDPELAKKVPVPPLQEKPAPQHSNKYAKKIDSILAGNVGEKKGVASASMAVAGDSMQENRNSLASGHHSEPAAGTKGKQVNGKGGKGSQVAKMWEKAPAKSKKQDNPAAKNSAPAVVQQDMARASSGEEDSGDDQEEESPQPIKRKASRQAVFDEEDSGDEDAQPLAQAKRQKLGKADKPPGKKSKTAAAEESSQDIEIDLSEDENAASEEPQAPKRTGRPKKASQSNANEKAAGSRPKKGTQKPNFGSMKANENAPTGSKRRKVSRTVINSKGEEITEEVWEEEPPTDKGEGQDVKASSPEQAAAKSGAIKANPKKPLASPAKPAARKPVAGNKGKSAGQKGIMSFFGKK